jgi:hypothetical protein
MNPRYFSDVGRHKINADATLQRHKGFEVG